jgi:hypothetical protein
MRKTTPKSAQEPVLALTGERQRGRYQVLVCGTPVYLTYSMLNVLVSLVIARGTSQTGFLPVSRITIRRLRKAIDEATGRGTGRSLIETGCGEEYRLAIPASRPATDVVVGNGFLELGRAGALSSRP